MTVTMKVLPGPTVAGAEPEAFSSPRFKTQPSIVVWLGSSAEGCGLRDAVSRILAHLWCGCLGDWRREVGVAFVRLTRGHVYTLP